MAKKKRATKKKVVKKSTRATGGRSVNKTAEVDKILTKSPNASPKEIAEKLKAQGINITTAYVSTIKTNLKGKAKKGQGKKRVGKKRAAGSPRRVQRAASNDAVTLEALVEAKQLVETLGGIEQAQQALDALAQLQ